MRYISKDALLVLLGTNANAFVQFFLTPEIFGVTEPLLSQIKISKQKLDWAGGFDITLPEVQQMLTILETFGVITAENITAINSIADNPNMDTYTINILAQDDITITNLFGAIYVPNGWKVIVTFKNNTKNTLITEDFVFDTVPSQEEVNAAIADKITQLKRVNI